MKTRAVIAQTCFRVWKRLSWRSSHNMIVRCSDKRINRALMGFLRLDELVAMPGIVRQLAESSESIALSQISSLAKLKGTKQVRLYTHEDCGYYSLIGVAATADQLLADLNTAALTVSLALPHVKVKGHLVKLRQFRLFGLSYWPPRWEVSGPVVAYLNGRVLEKPELGQPREFSYSPV